MATVNPKNNLAHCFCCRRNINNIDLMIELGYDFKQAVSILENWMHQYKTVNGMKTRDTLCRICQKQKLILAEYRLIQYKSNKIVRSQFGRDDLYSVIPVITISILS